MKKILILFFAGVLISALCAGCNELKQDQQQPPQTEEGAEIDPIPINEVDDEITAFFDKHLPPISGSANSDCFFVNDNEDKCLIINSDKELQAITHSSVELPAIDFDKYTLIIGQHWMGDPGYTLEKQAVDTEPEEMVLNLVYKRMEGASPAVPTIFYFWGLYPKLPQKSVILNIVKQYI